MEKYSFNLREYDPIKIGLNIRAIRQNKRISISKLSVDSYISSGKISYLENGKISKVHFDEIRTIAKALEVDVTDILSEDTLLTPPIEKFTSLIDLTLQFVKSGLIDKAEKMKMKIRNSVTSKELEWLKPAFLFIDSQISKSRGDKQKAIDNYKEISALSGNHSILSHYKVRSLNALSCELYRSKEISEALKYSRDALRYIDENRISDEVKSNTLYNLSLLYSFIGYTDVAMMHAKDAALLSDADTVFQTEIKFALGIYSFIKEDIQQAKDYITEALTYYQKTSDSTTISNMYKCFYTLYLIDPENHKLIEEFFDGDFLSAMNTQSIFHIELLHNWIELMLKENRSEDVLEHVKYCIEIADEMPDSINKNTFWLASLYYKAIGKITEQTKMLHRTSQYVDQSDHLQLGKVMYALAEIEEGSSNSLFKQAAQTMNAALNNLDHNQIFGHLQNLLPEPRY